MSFSEEVSEILKTNSINIIGNPISDAVKGVQKTVEQLVKRANLPDEIAIRYKVFAGDEGLLYSSESYRDHFFHPFHTFLLGFLLLNKFKLAQQKRQTFPHDIPLDDIFLKKWLLTSLWHDITYAAEKGPSWLQGFIKGRLGFEIRADQDWGPILSNIDNLQSIDRLSGKFDDNNKKRRLIFRTWLHKQIEEWHDHGVLSGILLLKEAEKWNCILNKDILNECGLAIALHNYHKALSKSPVSMPGSLAIKKYPLAFLLAYCDTAQEWGRPSSKQTTINCEYGGMDKGTNEIVTYIKYDINELIKVYKYNLPKNDVFSAFVDEQTKKLADMEYTWKSDNWKYSLETIVIDEGNKFGSRTINLAKI